MQPANFLVVVLFSLYLSSAIAATCTWKEDCNTEPVNFDPVFSEYCWTCDGGGMPNGTHDVTISAGDATGFDITYNVALKSLSITGMPFSLLNSGLTIETALTLTNCNVNIKNSAIRRAKSYINQVPFTHTGAQFVASSLSLENILLQTNAAVKISGNTSLVNSHVTFTNSALFYQDNSGRQLYATGSEITNRGAIIMDNFKIFGDAQCVFNLLTGGSLTIGQATTSYGEVDINDMILFIQGGATLNIRHEQLLELNSLSVQDGAIIVLDGILRFDDFNIRPSFGNDIFIESAPGVLASYNNGFFSFSGQTVNLSLATLQVVGGEVNFQTASASINTLTFKNVFITNGGEIGNIWQDGRLQPATTVINAESFTVINGSIAMAQGKTLTLNSDLYLQNYFELKAQTSVIVNGDVTVLGANMRGGAGNSLLLASDTVQFYDTNFTWRDVAVKVQGSVEFYIPSPMPSNSAFVFAPTGSIDMSAATIKVVLDEAPTAYGTFNLVNSPVLTVPATRSVAGTYSCLGGNFTAGAQGLSFNLPQPSIAAPSNLAASMTGDSVVIRWTAPTNLPCHHTLNGYNVKIGDNTYHVIQQAIVLDIKLFPECEVHMATVQATAAASYSSTLLPNSLWSGQDSFMHIPTPASPKTLASTVDVSGVATVKFGVAPSSLCSCSSMTDAYYSVTYLDKTVQIRADQMQISDLPAEHDVDIVVSTVCLYNGMDPSSVSSLTVSTRVSTTTNPPSAIVKSGEGKLSGGQIAGIVIGIVGGVAFGVVVGLLIGKRAYTKFGSGNSGL